MIYAGVVSLWPPLSLFVFGIRICTRSRSTLKKHYFDTFCFWNNFNKAKTTIDRDHIVGKDNRMMTYLSKLKAPLNCVRYTSEETVLLFAYLKSIHVRREASSHSTASKNPELFSYYSQYSTVNSMMLQTKRIRDKRCPGGDNRKTLYMKNCNTHIIIVS